MTTRRLAWAAPLAALLLLAPVVGATWSVKGALEPDTSYDLTGWMRTEPNNKFAGDLVYFNGFGSPGAPALTTINPNLAISGTRMRAAPFLPVAVMGVWKDCNDDGYVGLGDQGVLEYRSQLLLNDSICPPIITPPGSAPLGHNDGTWIVELIPIGYDDVTTHEDDDPWTINDTSARVWADWGVPGEDTHITCAMYPTPQGTFRSTGGTLRWLDCLSGFRVVPLASDAFEQAGLHSFSFHDAADDRPDQSGSQLNQPNPWGRESDPPAATVFDCATRMTVALQDPTGGQLRTVATVPMPDGSNEEIHGTDAEGRIVNVTVPGIAPTPGTGSPAGTVNATEAALTDCDNTNQGAIVEFDGRHAGSDGDLPYLLEGDQQPITPYSLRTRTDHVFTFEEGSRDGLLSIATGARSRDDAGTGSFSVKGAWVGTAAALGGPNPFLSRNDMIVEGASYITYYGYASPSLLRDRELRLPTGEIGEYGREACSKPIPIFDCDPARWWRDAGGRDITPRDARLGSLGGDPTKPAPTDATKIGVSMGQLYNMRDVDCVDMSASPARDLGLHWGRLTATACH